jgi:two-component system sensor histidine kinase MprB
VLLAVLASYAVVRSQLRGQVDDSLNAQEQAVINGYERLGQQFPGISARAGGPAQYVQAVLQDGAVDVISGNLTLPVSARVRTMAQDGAGQTYLSDGYVGGNHLRIITFAVPQLEVFSNGGERVESAAVELARPLNGVDTVLSHLRLFLALLFCGGIALAALLGRIASRRVLRPLAEVAEVAEHIGETDDLSERLKVHADDEVGALATRFNTMLDRLQGSRNALDESVRAQRQLVADASHELRTPVTSLRTNVEVLLESDVLDPEDRRRLLADVVEQSEELTALVNDLIELARGDQPGAETDDVRLDGVAEESLARARRNAPQVIFEADIRPALLDGVPERLGRAINNLLDNAARHSAPGQTVVLTVSPSGVQVRDHGPGVPESDQPFVFDRFFRGSNSRGRQGSGLGLAIVRQVTEQHGGTVAVANAPDGGAIFTLSLPGTAPDLSGEDREADQPAPARGTDGRAERAIRA